MILELKKIKSVFNSGFFASFNAPKFSNYHNSNCATNFGTHNVTVFSSFFGGNKAAHNASDYSGNAASNTVVYSTYKVEGIDF